MGTHSENISFVTLTGWLMAAQLGARGVTAAGSCLPGRLGPPRPRLGAEAPAPSPAPWSVVALGSKHASPGGLVSRLWTEPSGPCELVNNEERKMKPKAPYVNIQKRVLLKTADLQAHKRYIL